MGGRYKKSKKRCDANEGDLRPEQPVFFIDEALDGRIIPKLLSDAGFSIATFSDYFNKGTPDIGWLTEVGRRGWVVLTKDKRIRRRRLERDALFEANVAAFVITSKSLRGEEIANIFIKAKNRMIKILTKHPKPFIAAVTRDGKVKLIVEADAFQ